MDPRSSEPMDAVRVAIASLTSPWTIEQLADEVGSSPEEVGPYVGQLIDGGTIEDLGEDPRHDGDGPAPRLYGPPHLGDIPADKDVTLD